MGPVQPPPVLLKFWTMDMSERPPDASGERTRHEIQTWLVDYLARQLQQAPERIDVNMPFENFAMDSVTVLAMTGELETWLGYRVDPTLVYDYPTVAEIATYLAENRS